MKNNEPLHNSGNSGNAGPFLMACIRAFWILPQWRQQRRDRSAGWIHHWPCDSTRIFWTLLSPDGKYAKAAIIHDYLYDNALRTKKEADRIFLDGMTVLGMPKWKRTIMYWAVRWFGRGMYWSQCYFFLFIFSINTGITSKQTKNTTKTRKNASNVANIVCDIKKPQYLLLYLMLMSIRSCGKNHRQKLLR